MKHGFQAVTLRGCKKQKEEKHYERNRPTEWLVKQKPFVEKYLQRTKRSSIRSGRHMAKTIVHYNNRLLLQEANNGLSQPVSHSIET